MNKNEKYLLNCVNIFLSQCVDNNTIIKTNDIVDMFRKIFNNDSSYINYCPIELRDDLNYLVQNIYKYQTTNFKQSSLKVLLKCFYDDISYRYRDNMKINNKQKDILWFKALIANQISYNMLSEYNNTSNFESFKVEYSEIGSLLNNYYSERDPNKANIIKDFINSKVNDLYFRYNIRFDLPKCAS